MQKHYYVRPVWDDEAKTFYTDSDIWGLHIETPSLEEFEALVFELGPEMIMANHLTAAEAASTPLLQLVPTIVFKAPLAAAE
ncbi:MAG TPA: hypothetical protein VHB19_07245 [Devosia sp.]|jgi:hypothetical protein|nr:hypothetical protein [Devosia sp.]